MDFHKIHLSEPGFSSPGDVDSFRVLIDVANIVTSAAVCCDGDSLSARQGIFAVRPTVGVAASPSGRATVFRQFNVLPTRCTKYW